MEGLLSTGPTPSSFWTMRNGDSFTDEDDDDDDDDNDDDNGDDNG